MAKKVEPVGTKEETSVFTEVNGHYTMAREDLDQRISRKNGFDDADKMFASHIDEAGWPYKSLMFDPRPYTVIIEKAARLIGSKPKGRMVPREGGDTLGAYINNELLSFQWDDNSRLGESMIGKWIQMDMNARKYGASFGLVKWSYECRINKDGDKAKKKVFYDGPDFTVCSPRDVLANPSYNIIKKWFQYREYVTIDELEKVNDAARAEPVYKNLDLLRESVKKGMKRVSGDMRSSNYVVQNKTIRGLDDFLGRDELYKTIEVVTEYRPDRWITFAPRHGVVIRDIPNPYKHGEIPVVQLKYYPLPDDLYGVSEYEPAAKQIRAINAFLSAFVDRMSLRLKPPIMVNPTAVKMHTLDFLPEAKWLMNNPGVDVQTFKMEGGEDAAFQQIYTVLVSSLLNTWGENSQGVSQVNPLQDSGKVTATEIRDTAFTRNVRDNMNQIFLAEALKRQMVLWHSMNQQFMFGPTDQAKIVRIVGRDAVEFFTRKGLSDIRPTAQDAQQIAMGQLSPSEVPNGPVYAVDLGDGGGEVPKFQPDDNGEGGNLLVEPSDLLGTYDYIPDIETMSQPSRQDTENKLTALLATVTNPTISKELATQGYRPKVKDILIRAFEASKAVKDAEALFEELPQAQSQLNVQDSTLTGGVQGTTGGTPAQGANPAPGMVSSPPPVFAGQNPQLMA